MNVWVPIFWFAAALVGGAASAPAEVEEAALGYVEAVRAGTPETAASISPSTAPGRREDIWRQWRSLQRTLEGSGAPQVEAVRVEGNLGAALVRMPRGGNPVEVVVVGVALVHRDGKWQAAPVPGLFDNAGLPYDPEVRAKAEELEYWLARQQVERLDALHRKASAEFVAAMRESVDPELLLGEPEEVMERFLQAVERRDFPATMALLGGLQKPRPQDWEEKLEIVSHWIGQPAANDLPLPWRLLLDPEIARAVLHAGEAVDPFVYFAVGFYDPHRVARQSAALQQLHFELEKVGDHWRVELPEELRIRAGAGAAGGDEAEIFLGGEDEDLANWFPERFEERYEARRFESPGALAEAVDEALRSGKFPELMAMLARSAASPVDRRSGYRALARLWHELRPEREAAAARILGIREEGPVAAVALAGFSARRGDDLLVRELFAIRGDDGWSLRAEGIPEAEEIAEALQRLKQEEGERLAAYRAPAREIFLKEAFALQGVPEAGVSGDEALETVRRWLMAANAGDLEEMLRLSAWIPGPAEARAVLRSLGYQAAAARRSVWQADVLETHREGAWTAVTARMLQDFKPVFPLHAVVATPDGPKVLLTVDLVAPAGRVRGFLNEAQWPRLRKLLPEEEVEHLRELFSRHRKFVRAELERAEKN